MPLILDNAEQHMLPELTTALLVSHRADFRVGYFKLLGWKDSAGHVDFYQGNEVPAAPVA